MNIPDSILTTLQDKHNLNVTGTKTESGGSINHAFQLETNRGNYFLKWNASAPDDFFEKEAEGLKLLNSAGTKLLIPEVIASGKPEPGHPGFLLMEYIETGRSGNSFAFGSELARLHHTTTDHFGLDSHNYIGSLPQSNHRHPDWPGFFSEERIRPQLRMAIDSGKLNTSVMAQWEQIEARLADLLPEPKPSLVHGDLWGGNYMFNTDRNAVLIDPAVYYGHPEMDLAFSKMFGGFSTDFYRGYESETKLEPGFEDRIPLHNLYPLLVHVNLFGGHYVSQAQSVLKRFA